MDELSYYLSHTNCYKKSELEQILNKKIVITRKHIENIDLKYHYHFDFNIIKLFETYGYYFTNDDYILLVRMNGILIQCISEDNITDEICKIAIQQNGCLLQCVPNDKKTDKICKIAVQKNEWALEYVPESPINGGFCKKPL